MNDDPGTVDADATEVQDADVIPPAPDTPRGELVTTAQQPGGSIILADSPEDMIVKATAVANALSGVLEGQGLTTAISNRKHINVEGWQTLGTLLGIFPTVVWSQKVMGEDGHPLVTEYPVHEKIFEWVTPPAGGKKVKQLKAERDYVVKGYDWEAKVEVRTMSGAIVGSAEAMCTRKEKRWAEADDYALRSMAQTRATSRALKAAAGWIVTLKGYSATPQEEMTGVADAAVADAYAAMPYGAAADPTKQDSLLRAIAYLFDPAPEDPSASPAPALAIDVWAKVEALVNSTSPEANAYMPAVVALSFLEAAKVLRAHLNPVDPAQDALPVDPPSTEGEATNA